MSMIRPQHILPLVLFATILGASGTKPAMAQRYTRVPYGAKLLDANGELDDRKRKQAYSAKMGVLKGPMDAAASDALDTWYNQYLFRHLTRLEAEPELPTIVGDIVKDISQAEGGVKTYILSTAMSTMTAIAKGNFSPAARINAMQVIASLNQAERDQRTSMVPTPYRRAMQPLREAMIDPKQLDGVRLVALLGLLRHVESQWVPGQPRLPASGVTLLLGDAKKILDQKDPAPGKDKRGHDWMRMRAMQLMVALNTPGPNDSVFNALYQVATDKTNEWYLRCAAVEGMGRMELAKSQSIKEPQYAATVKVLGEMIAEICHQEANRLKDLESEIKLRKEAYVGLVRGGGGSMGPMGGMGGGMSPGMDGMDGEGADGMMDDMGGAMGPMGMGPMGMGGFGMTQPRVVPMYLQSSGRRRVIKRLLKVQEGLNGPPGRRIQESRTGVSGMVADDREVKRVTKLNEALTTLLTELEEEELPLEDIVTKYRSAANEFATIVEIPPPTNDKPKAPAGPAAPAAPVPGNGAAAPVPGNGAAAPVPGNGAAAPVPGNGAAAPVPGNGAAAPVPGNGAAAPVPGNGAAAPVPGNGAAAPVPGNGAAAQPAAS